MAPTLRHRIGCPPWPPPPGCSSRAPGRTRFRAPSPRRRAPRRASRSDRSPRATARTPARRLPLRRRRSPAGSARPPSPAPTTCAASRASASAAATGAASLRRGASSCGRRGDELARALTLDQGKPLHAEAYDEVDELVAMWRGAAEDGIRLEGSIPPSMNPGTRVLLVRRALGPVAVVTPWNWPYTMPAEIVAPALACGNTVVWTPAPSTAVCSGLLAEGVAEADLPPGVFTFVPGPGPVVGDELVGHADIAGVGFIGSTQTGLRIARRAAG